MTDVEDYEEQLLGFKEGYLKDPRKVNTYRKLKRYTRYGTYISGFLIYMLVAFYVSAEFPVTGLEFITTSILTLISISLTTIFKLNKRDYDFDEHDMVYHEFALFISSLLESTPGDDLTDEVERFNNLVLDNDSGILPKVWKVELESYIQHIEDREGEANRENFVAVLAPLVKLLEDLDDLNLRERYESGESPSEAQLNQNPGFLQVVIESITSDVVSKEMVIWSVFLIAVGVGLVVAFLQGQGWGVLLVTIVFGGLRIYDQQRD